MGVWRIEELRKAVGDGMAIVSMKAPPGCQCCSGRVVGESRDQMWGGEVVASMEESLVCEVWRDRDGAGGDAGSSSLIGPSLTAAIAKELD